MAIHVQVDIGTARTAAMNAEKYVQRLYQGRKASIMNWYGTLIDPWVPYKTGQLAGYEVDASNDCLIYSATSPTGYNYADIQYNKPMNHSTAVHPFATDHWNEVAQPIIEDEFIEGVKEILHR